jgi:hypothetical protein
MYTYPRPQDLAYPARVLFGEGDGFTFEVQRLI